MIVYMKDLIYMGSNVPGKKDCYQDFETCFNLSSEVSPLGGWFALRGKLCSLCHVAESEALLNYELFPHLGVAVITPPIPTVLCIGE